MHILTIIGLLFNSVLLCVNRFVKRMPDWLYIGGMGLGIAAMFVGILLTTARK